MNRNELLTQAQKDNIILSSDALEMLESAGYDQPFVHTTLEAVRKSKAIATRQDIEDFLYGDKGLSEVEKAPLNKVRRNGEIKILAGTDITGNSTCEGTVDDFIKYFQSRYQILSKILAQNHEECRHHVSVAQAMKDMIGIPVTIVVMVSEVSKTKNGHTIVDVEDMSGQCPVFIGKDSELSKMFFVNDEVIGVRGKSTEKGLFIPTEILRPSVPYGHRWTPSDSVSSVAFISDIHVGSREFIRGGWDRMTNWLRHNRERQCIDYLVIAGDMCDGIGVYPDQDKDLVEQDIYRQYGMLAELLKDIPDGMNIVMHPGNHDACRLAEPQPAFKDVYTHDIDRDVTITGNPISFQIEGRTVTSYHGASLFDFINAVPGLKMEQPVPIMEQMIERRHLAPIYGGKNPLAPEVKDYLALETLPDILVTGHIHQVGIGEYKGVKLVNAGCWMNQSEYQKRHNFMPTPSKMPIIHLGSGRTTVKDFNK